AAGLFLGAAHVDADADDAFTLRCLDARRRARMRVDGDVLMELVHVLPRGLLAHQLDPRVHGLVAGARRRRVRHHDRVLVCRIRQTGPRRGLREVFLAGFDSVVTDDREPRVHAGPSRWILAALEYGLYFGDTLRRVRLEHAHRVEQRDARGAETPDHVGTGIV